MTHRTPKNLLTKSFIVLIIATIAGIYYQTELRPFYYQEFDLDINLFQRYNSELDEAIVQTRFGVIKNYDPILIAFNGLHSVIDHLKGELVQHPNKIIAPKLQALETQLQQKEDLTESFKTFNPIVLNAVGNFSDTMAKIIEDESNVILIESCLEKEYHFQLMDKINTLFREMLLYVNSPTDEKHGKLVEVLAVLKDEPKSLEHLDLGLAYANVILSEHPKLTQINHKILSVPIFRELQTL